MASRVTSSLILLAFTWLLIRFGIEVAQHLERSGTLSPGWHEPVSGPLSNHWDIHVKGPAAAHWEVWREPVLYHMERGKGMVVDLWETHVKKHADMLTNRTVELAWQTPGVKEALSGQDVSAVLKEAVQTMPGVKEASKSKSTLAWVLTLPFLVFCFLFAKFVLRCFCYCCCPRRPGEHQMNATELLREELADDAAVAEAAFEAAGKVADGAEAALEAISETMEDAAQRFYTASDLLQNNYNKERESGESMLHAAEHASGNLVHQDSYGVQIATPSNQTVTSPPVTNFTSLANEHMAAPTAFVDNGPVATSVPDVETDVLPLPSEPDAGTRQALEELHRAKAQRQELQKQLEKAKHELADTIASNEALVEEIKRATEQKALVEEVKRTAEWADEAAGQAANGLAEVARDVAYGAEVAFDAGKQAVEGAYSKVSNLFNNDNKALTDPKALKATTPSSTARSITST
mmetsp:Transcript_53222/g.99849  ORF Transcript_53222/g.99849 Transcript_53222/m.99849 type:complete len:464 (+) Transcript_53222:114-1505(+)